MKNKEQIFGMLKEFFPLLVIIALQQLLAFTVNLIDNFMLGSYSEVAMSGAALANQVQFVLQMVVNGVGTGAMVLGAQYWGKKEIPAIKSVVSVGMKLAAVIGIGFTVVVRLIPGPIMTLFTNDLPIREASIEYLSIICFTYIIFALSSTLMFSLRSVQTAFIGMVMSACTIGINAFLNYGLIFGNFGMPELGVKGAAYATLVSRTAELIIILIYVLFVDKKLHMKLLELIKWDGTYWKDYLRIAGPVILTGAQWGVAQSVTTMIIGHMSPEAIGANSVATVVFQMFAVFGFSCSSAASVIIGKTIGKGQKELIKPYSITLQIVFLIIGVITGIGLMLARGPIVSMYVLSDGTRDLAMTFLLILGITLIGTCYEYPTGCGIIAGGGDTKTAAIVDNVAMWCVVIPLAALSAFVFHWSPVVTFCILKSDQIFKSFPYFIRCNRYKWVRDLTK